MNKKSENDVILKGIDRKLTEFTKKNQSKWSGPFTFVVMADTQYGLTSEFESGDDEKWVVEVAYTEASIAQINQVEPRPSFVVVCGDMINSFPGKNHRAAQINDFIKTFQKLSPYIPLICVCGNHDVGNTPTKETINEYNSVFGDDYMQFWVKGVKFIVLNSQYYADRSACKPEAEEHDNWLNNVLNHEENKCAKHLIVFQHIPWFINEPQEKDDYFNIDYGLRQTMLEKLSLAGVEKIFAGHCHKNAGGWFEDKNGHKMELVVTSAVGYQLGDDEHGFRMVTVDDDKIFHEYREIFLNK